MAVADKSGLAGPRASSELRQRTVSAIGMIAVTGTALWLRGWVWKAVVALIAIGLLWEWVKLARAIATGPAANILWFAAGVIYIGLAAAVMWSVDTPRLLIMVLCVIATDIGAFFTGRRFGGPRIAPRISPSKTWTGLGGGMAAAGLMFWAVPAAIGWASPGRNLGLAALQDPITILVMVLMGALIAVIAQTGDFGESWMKRRAGVKDSGNLIPGHGGLFDRADGLLAVLFVAGLVTLFRYLA